jgi:hypothetical protein
MRRYLIAAAGVMLAVIMVLGSGALSSPGSEENKGLGYLHPSASDYLGRSWELWPGGRLWTSGALDTAYYGGSYVDAQTGTMPMTATIHIGLTVMEGEHTEFIKAIAGEVEGVKVEFFEVRFTMRELATMQRQIMDLFGPRVLTLVDVPNNSLIVALNDLTPADVAAIWGAVGEEAPIQICDGWEIALDKTG